MPRAVSFAARKENFESLMCENRPAWFILSLRAPKMIYSYAKMSLGWLRVLVCQYFVLRTCHVVLKPKVIEITEIEETDEEEIAYENFQPVIQSRRD